MEAKERLTRTPQRVERLAGMRDVEPLEYALRSAAVGRIEETFRTYGYQGVEVPILENAELQLRKSGESLRRSMYFMSYQGEGEGGDEIALRPELTASVARFFNAKFQSNPLPIRLYYVGPAFRHDRPQLGRYREFTHIGVELIGASGPDADAEIIALARDVVESLGIREYKILIGNIGVLMECLKAHTLQKKTRVRILESLEDIGKSEDRESSIDKLEAELLETSHGLGERSASDSQLVEVLKRLEGSGLEGDVESIVDWVLRLVFDNRPGLELANEAEGVLGKIRAMEERENIPKIISFIRRLVQINGRPPAVLSQVEELLKDSELPTDPVKRLESMGRHLDMYGIDWSKTDMDFGFGRGLTYYTGMIFEIHDSSGSLEAQKQICGGGRYDELVGDLGGQKPVPALGFAFGLERLLLMGNLDITPKKTGPALIVVPMDGDEVLGWAVTATAQLRKAGLGVELCSANVTSKKHTERAAKLHIPYVAYIGQDELEGRSVTVRTMSAGTQKKGCSIEDVVNMLRHGETA